MDGEVETMVSDFGSVLGETNGVLFGVKEGRV